MLLNCVNFDVFFLSLDFKKIYSEKKKALGNCMVLFRVLCNSNIFRLYGILLPSWNFPFFVSAYNLTTGFEKWQKTVISLKIR